MLKENYSPPVIWTPDMDAALIELRANRVGYVSCAKRIGVAPSTLAKRVRALGLPILPRGRVQKARAQ